MKQLFLAALCLAAIACQGADGLSKGYDECVLSAEFYPLAYHLLTRSTTLRVRVTSNCSLLRDLHFAGFFSFDRKLSSARHPRTVVLNIFRNQYRLEFSKPVMKRPETPARRLEYQALKVTPASAKRSVSVDVSKDNRVVLRERVKGSFTLANFRKFVGLPTTLECGVDSTRLQMRCDIN